MPRFNSHPLLRRRIAHARASVAPDSVDQMDASGDIGDVSVNSSNKLDSNMYIIGGVDGGGSLKFINDFKMCFPKTKHITTAKELRSTDFSVLDTLFLQHLYKSDLTHSMICEIVKRTGCRLIISIHDFYYLSLEYDNAPHNNYLKEEIVLSPIIKELFSLATHIIHPSKFTADVLSKYFPSTNFTISSYPDFKVLESDLSIPPINRNINIGVLTENSEYKGKEYNSFLSSIVISYKGFNITYHIVGKTLPAYKENEFFEVIKKNNIHGLLALNKWGETYGYAMSKYLKSGLPFLYNNIGAFKERVPIKPQYIKAFDEEIESFTSEYQGILQEKFKELLDFIIANKEPYDPKRMVDLSFEIPEIYKFIFNNNYFSKPLWDKIHNKIKPYAIYFPQFHQIAENDVNFYPGMTDMTSLCELIKAANPDNLDTPSIKDLELTSLIEYDQSDNKLVQRQIELAKKAGMCGFSIYYYWFSNNTITGKNMIFEKCINNFFTDVINDFKVFFTWANEDWTKNLAFTDKDSSINISNQYSRDKIQANFNNLLAYFKHPNYLKIDNCPVFYIHHPWEMKESELLEVKQIFTEMAIKNGFDGINLRASSMDRKYDFIDTFDFCPKYKHVENISYVNCVSSDNDSSIYFSFNNSARMFRPAKPSIKKIVAMPRQQKQMLQTCVTNYVASSQDLFLVNSWNEWGENMAIEPGEHNGSFYIHLLKQEFSRYVN